MNIIVIQRGLGNLFSINDLAKLTKKSKRYLAKYMNEQIKKGYAYSVRRGYYSFSEIIDKFQLATTFANTYISLRSAIEYYELTTQRYIDLDLMTFKTKEEQVVQDTKIHFIKTKKQNFFGYKKERYKGQEILVATKEKLLIDCVLYQNRIGVEEVKELIDTITIDKERMQAYLERIHSSALNKRIGYLLEQKGIELDLEINSKYELLSVHGEKVGKQNRKWRLIVND